MPALPDPPYKGCAARKSQSQDQEAAPSRRVAADQSNQVRPDIRNCPARDVRVQDLQEQGPARRARRV
jgi:hypothetical protein